MEFSLLSQQLFVYVKQACNYFWQKLGFALLFGVLAPHSLAIHGLALVFLLDFICGVWAAKKTRTLSSTGMRRGVAKLLIYFIFIDAVALAEHSILQTTICTNTAIGILCATEVLSIIENLVVLGLPIPYASKILAMVSNKAANYGIKLDIDSNSSMASSRDIITIIEVTIPAIVDRPTQRCMRVFCSNWYQWMRSLDGPMFSGSHDLVWERLRHSMDRTLIEIRSFMTKESVPLALQDVFLKDWAGTVLTAFYTSTQTGAQTDAEPMKRIEMVQDALCLMLLRLVQVAQDKKALVLPA